MQWVDAHHHLWIPEQSDPDLGYVWLRDVGAMKPFGDPTSIQRDYEWPEFLRESDRHQMTGSVYVQVDGAIADPIAETAWVQSVFDASPLPHGIVGFADLTRTGALAGVETQSRFPAFRGVRQILSRLDDRPELCFAPRHYLEDPVFRENFAALAGLGLSFDLQLYPEQMVDAAELLAAHPDIPVIVDHVGSPYDQTPAGLAIWEDGLRVLAELDHVCMKLSGFGMFDTHWTAESAWRLVAPVLTHFGVDRVMFGSNYPVDKLMATLDSIIERVSVCLEGLDDADRRAVFETTAQRVYRLTTATV